MTAQMRLSVILPAGHHVRCSDPGGLTECVGKFRQFTESFL